MSHHCWHGGPCGAVQVTAIAVTADQHLHPAALAQKQPRRRAVDMAGAIVPGRGRLMAWTRLTPGAIMLLHSCPCTV